MTCALGAEKASTMEIEKQDSTESKQADGSERLQQIGRRAFILSAAGAASALAFWGLRRSTIAAARPLGADEGPKQRHRRPVFADGKRVGPVTVPRVIKTDDEWRRQLSQTSYWVTRHADTERPFTGDLE